MLQYSIMALQVGGVSDETINYSYGFCATGTTERMHSKLQTSPLVRDCAPQKTNRKFQAATYRQEVISGLKFEKSVRHHHTD
jgi:hypothetical protein